MPANKIAQVVVGLPVEGPFDYSLTASQRDKAAAGARVKVSFHVANRVGFIVGFRPKSDLQKIKPIGELIDTIPVLDDRMLKLTKEFAGRYGCSWGEAIETSLPGLLRKGKAVDISGYRAVKRSPKASPEHILLHDKGQEKRWEFIVEYLKTTLAKGKGVIFLVPEVHLIELVKERLKPHFSGEFTLLDKRLTAKKECESWAHLKLGKTQMVIGTRSAIFAPVRDPGLIVVYDEENNAYKQEQSPFYHARDVAFMRSKIEQSSVLLVSSAPSAETWSRAKSKTIKLITLEGARPADMQLVDMSNYNPRKSSIISVVLKNTMEKTLADKGRIVLFMNRKGFSTQTACNKCGFVLKCRRCDVSLTYLYAKKKLVCRRCGDSKKMPAVCPECQSAYLRSKGTGIEKLESEVARVFPQARVGHLDKDTESLKSFDILIATQAVLKYQGKVPVSLIGVLRIDSELNRLDFRSGQKTFSLLVHLRQFSADKLIVQTRMPDNYSLKAAQDWDFDAFYRQELEFRKELKFPPYRGLIAVNLRAAKEETVFAQVTGLHDRMVETKPKGIEILDPHPDIVPKLRDKYRYTFMVRGKKTGPMLRFVKKTLKDFKKGATTVTVNVEP